MGTKREPVRPCYPFRLTIDGQDYLIERVALAALAQHMARHRLRVVRALGDADTWVPAILTERIDNDPN